MNPFEVGKKIGQLEKVASDARSILDKALKLDKNGNGVADSAEILKLLSKLPDVIQDKSEEARAECEEIFREIARLVGDDVNEIQKVAAKEIESLQKNLEQLK